MQGYLPRQQQPRATMCFRASTAEVCRRKRAQKREAGAWPSHRRHDAPADARGGRGPGAPAGAGGGQRLAGRGQRDAGRVRRAGALPDAIPPRAPARRRSRGGVAQRDAGVPPRERRGVCGDGRHRPARRRRRLVVRHLCWLHRKWLPGDLLALPLHRGGPAEGALRRETAQPVLHRLDGARPGAPTRGAPLLLPLAARAARPCLPCAALR